jgi:predicted dehydrogenase
MTTVALVGVAHIHTPGFIRRLLARDDVQVKYVWDHQPERAQKRAEELSTQVVDTPDTVWVDKSIDAAIICSETNRHEELVLSAAAAKKHIFVEKPLGMGAKDAYRMADAIEQVGVLFQTGYFMRGMPVHRFLREQIQAGNLGKVTRVRMSNCHAGSLKGWFDTDWRWMADPSVAGCGAFGDLGTHRLDIMLWLLGDPVSVTADIGVATGRYGDCDEYGEGLLKFEGGAIGVLAGGWVDLANPVPLLISGTEGHAYIANGEFYFQSEHVPGADGKEPWTDLPEPWPHAFDLFLDALAGKDVSLVSAREAAVRSAVMEAMYEASKNKTWVEPSR